MKGLLITSISIFLLGFTFRLLHWPGSALLTLVSIFLVFIFAIINSISKKEIFNISIFGGWILFSWPLYIFFKYLFWNTGPSILGFNSMFLVVFILTVIYVSTTVSGKVRKLSKTVLTVSIFAIIFSFIPSHSICYFFDLNEVINNEYNKTNYYSWDKYSWFLYIRGEKERALEANQKAIDAWYNSENIYYTMNPESSVIPTLLDNHRQGIIDGTWTEGYMLLRLR